MANKQPKNRVSTKTRDNPLLPAAKNAPAPLGQKKANAVRGHERNVVMDKDDENIDSTGISKLNRRSSRLNDTVQDAAATARKASKRGRTSQHRSSFLLSEDASSRAGTDDDEAEEPAPTPKRPQARSSKVTGRHKDKGTGNEGNAVRGRPVASTRGEGANPGRKARSRSPTPTHANAQAEASGLDEIQDLQRQLQEEKGHPSYHI